MIIKAVNECDCVNYKKLSMFLIFPICTFKCEKDCNKYICQNRQLINEPNIIIDANTIVNKYINNPLTDAIVCGGLEPFDSWEDLKLLIKLFREKSNDDIVIYTGYNKNEILDKIEFLKDYNNIIIKYGRYIPNQDTHYDSILGVNLASNNQYAEVI